MQFIYYAIAALVAVGASFLQIGVRKSNRYKEDHNGLFLKVFTYAFMIVFAVRCLSGKIALGSTIGLNLYSPFGTTGQLKVVLCVFSIWLMYPASILLATYPFFKDKIKSLTGLVKYFAAPVYLFSFVTIFWTFIALMGTDAYDGASVQGVSYAVEIGLGLAYCLGVWLKNPSVKADKKAVGKSAVIALLMTLSAMPTFVPQVLFGKGPATLQLMDLTIEHRIVLYAGFVIPVLVALGLGKFDYDHRRYALLFMSTAGMIGYAYGYTFSSLLNVTNWPLHLCNTAMFVVPVCLYFKLDKVFYFTLFINVLGAFLAMLMPNYKEGLGIWNETIWDFWLNHYYAFFLPILCIAMKMYARPKLKQFLYSLIGFGGYFVLVLILNAWFSNYGEVDYFFINSGFVAEKLGTWAENLRNVTIEFNIGDLEFTFYPIYQVLYFIVYVGLSFAMWFLYEQAFVVTDLYNELILRNKKIKADQLALEVKLGGKNVMEPINMENENKLILRNFSKKYSTSDVYAVKDANLEICGGQIFGFLGPNGAGKSTIIKSIVGIQSITSGEIEVCGYDVEKQSVGAKMQTGFVPDHYALYENLTGREYVNYIADLYSVSQEDRNARIEEYVERFNLQQAFDNPIKTYSHGMKQKITIMSALVHSPKLWILDEPLTGLDPESIFQVKEAMKKHAADGNIVFFSSHIIDVVERICDKIAIIKKGNVLCTRTIKELEERGIALEDYYMEMIDMKPKSELTLALENESKAATPSVAEGA